METAEFVLGVLEADRLGTPLPPLPPRRDSYAVSNAADLAGSYRSPDGRSLVFVADSDRLLLVRGDRRIPLESYDTDQVLGPSDSLALFPLAFRRTRGVVTEVDYGGDWYVNDRYQGPKSFAQPAAWDAYVGHYRIAQDWEPNFRIVERKGRLWYTDPSGDERELTPLAPGEFRLGPPQSAERLKFDQVLKGHALRANLSGMAYYRFFTP